MNPHLLTVEQVRSELWMLIDTYPTRDGKAEGENNDGEGSCVYYTTTDGTPVSLTYFDPSETPELAIPICIVAQWIESFHPYLKENNLIERILRENGTISVLDRDQVPFRREVTDLLGKAQNAQDQTDATWGDIDLMA